MHTKNGAGPRKAHGSSLYLVLLFPLSCFLLVIAGCGAPGEPMPPSPPIPVAVADLTARQAGDGVLLTFSMPGTSTLGERLTEEPTMEILRGSARSDGAPDAASFRVVDTLPGAVLNQHLQQGKIQFVDPISADEVRRRQGQTVIYRVRARVSNKKTSPSSNDVALKLYVVAAPVEALQAQVTEKGVDLKWAAPARTSAGDTLTAAIEEYRVYRGEVEPSSVEGAGKDLQQAKWKRPLVAVGAPGMPEYLDATINYGTTYIYVVRSVVQGGTEKIESGDSAAVVVTPQDTFPPAAPQGLVADVSAAGGPAVDLSWSINLEPDLAGYRVYRSENGEARGELLTRELLPTPAYRDTSVSIGRQYWYTVTAVDRTGNESSPSAAVAVDVTQPSR